MEGCPYLNFMSINRFILYLLYGCFYSFILFFFFVGPKSPNLGPNLTFFCRPVVAPIRGPHPLPGRPIFRPNKAMSSVHPAASLFSREKTHQKPNSVHISSTLWPIFTRGPTLSFHWTARHSCSKLPTRKEPLHSSTSPPAQKTPRPTCMQSMH